MTTPLEKLLESARTHLYPNYRQPDLVMSHGEGVYVWDTSGKRYLDMYAGIAVNVLGHAHPAIVSALQEQAARLGHMSNYFYNEPNIELAERLCRLTGMQRVLFGNSGTEANEAMLKLARHHFYSAGQVERYRVIAFENSFHGRTLGALALTGQDKYREGFGPLPGVSHVPFGDLAAVERTMGPDVAAVIVETVQGEGGVVPASAGFLEGLRKLTEAQGALLLIDEIQTGVARTGRFLGIHHYPRVRPDALSMAKALAGGVPIGAMLCTEKLAGALPPGSHGSTFGGNPLASRVALSVLDVVEKRDLAGHSARVGAYLGERLAALTRYPAVTGARGQGLLQALELSETVDARTVVTDLREAGVLVTVAGGRALRFSPPLIITQEQVDEGVGIVAEVVGRLT
ncbi:MAG TPA: aspartate aminotransferase family protein [Polyangiaceae bacterium]